MSVFSNFHFLSENIGFSSVEILRIRDGSSRYMSCVVSRASVSWCVQQPTGATAMPCPSESSHTQAFEGSTLRFKGE